MIASTLINYLCGLIITGALWKRWNQPIEILEKGEKRSFLQKSALFLSIVTNLSVLAMFKYFNFGVDSYNSIVGFLGITEWQWQNAMQISLPIGISFYTFQAMSYTIDVYLGNTRATRHLINFACFVTMFPQLIAGPIIRYRDIAEQLVHRVVNLEGFSLGVKRFIIGLGKKVLIANIVALPADQIFAIPADQLTFGLAWLGITCYTFHIYVAYEFRILFFMQETYLFFSKNISNS